MRDDLDALGVDAELVDQAARGRARSARRPRPSARTGAAAPRSWPGRGSRGRTSCAVRTRGRTRGSRCASSACTGSHWKCTTSAPPRAVAQHVGHVLGEPREPAARAPATSGRSARRPRSRGCRGTSPCANGPVTSVTSAPARASAALSAWSYGGVYAAGSTRWTRMSRAQYRRAAVAARGHLLRRQHEPARAAAARARRDRRARRAARAVRDRVPRARQRVDGRAAPRRRARTRRSTEVIALDRARAARARTTARCCSARAGPYALLLNEDAELLPGATAGAARRARARARAPRAAGARLLHPDGARAAVRVALPDAADRARRRAAAAPPQRAEHRRRDARGRLGAVVGDARPARRRPSRSAGSTRASSSTPTRSTSPGACATPAGRSSGCPRPGGPPRAAVDRRACPSGGSSSSPATATSTCASTTATPRRARACAGSPRPPYALRRRSPALVLPGHDPRRYWRHVDRDAAPRPRRGHPRGGRGVQPRDRDSSATAPLDRPQRGPLGRGLLEVDPAEAEDRVAAGRALVVDRGLRASSGSPRRSAPGSCPR